MRITPLDVRKQEFRKAVRGYDNDEVRGFLTTLAEEYEAVLVDNRDLRENVAKNEEKLGEYRQLEQTLRDTLMTAQRVMQDTKDNASREGELIVQQAQQQAQEIVSDCRRRTEELRREIISLQREKTNYLARFRSLAQAQIQFVDTHESDFENVDHRVPDIADTVVEEVRPATPRPEFKSPPVKPEPVVEKKSVTGEDVWRNYTPAAKEEAIQAVETAFEPYVPPTPETESTERVASDLAAAVELASKGIPVEAVSEDSDIPTVTLDPEVPEIVVPV